jgi:hypothetical protein
MLVKTSRVPRLSLASRFSPRTPQDRGNRSASFPVYVCRGDPMNSRRVFALLLVLLLFNLIAAAQDNRRRSVRVETEEGTYGVSSEKLNEKQLGVPVYPGARIKPQSGTSKDGANLSLDMGDESLSVLAQTYLSDDAPDRVVSFYKDRLAKYGPVLECRHGHAVGAVQTTGGLKCEGGDGDDNDVALKAGSENDQHIVGVKPSGKGSEIGIAVVKQKKHEPM